MILSYKQKENSLLKRENYEGKKEKGLSNKDFKIFKCDLT